MKVILASKSPRRRELLGRLFPSFDIMSADADETLPEKVAPRDGVELLAIRKGAAVHDMLRCDKTYERNTLIISADTLVELDGVPLGKPTDEAEAFSMLSSLSGKTHSVHTGVALHRDGVLCSGVATTRVTFRDLTEGEIYEYIKSGEPMDKAGAYGIQGLAGNFVKEIDGDFDTVVGLSLALVKTLAEKIYDKE